MHTFDARLTAGTDLTTGRRKHPRRARATRATLPLVLRSPMTEPAPADTVAPRPDAGAATVDFESLVRSHHRALVAVAAGMVGLDDAEEVVQTAWIKAYHGIDDFQGRASIRTWLTSIVINEARMYLRSRQRRAKHETTATPDPLDERFDSRGRWLEPPADWGAAADELLLREQFSNCLQRLLGRLPVRQRAVLELRDVQGSALAEVAEALELSAANVRVLLHRGRARLYTAIEHYLTTGQC